MSSRQKYYVVWKGGTPGIYTSWNDCLLQTKGYEGAKYKSFDTRGEAERAYTSSPDEYIVQKAARRTFPAAIPEAGVVKNSLAVDAACSGNPGQMEYRGVHVGNREELFHFGPIKGTNNIGEFLALVHGLAWLKKQGSDIPVYTDSVNAIKWVKQKKCKTQLLRTLEMEELFRIIERAENWLNNHTYTTPILKWKTKDWGEIPADFNRK
ncbi:Ribonuclease H [termite gut metagenome]|uniref:Ribonuclease H n=1 Tax=termite gut metagenome TaxID=433724 RepID=A0A5J4PLT2_9ZZZZ